MKINPIILLVSTLACIELASSQDESTIGPTLMKGKVKTDRTVNLDAIVDASPADVYRLWTSADGVKKFFAPEAGIDPKIGGRYQIIFFPSKDPEGESHGTKGARTLDLVPNQKLVFLVDHICRRRFAREKRAALRPAVGAESHSSPHMGGAVLRTGGGSTKPDSSEIRALWISRRRKMGTIIPMV